MPPVLVSARRLALAACLAACASRPTSPTTEHVPVAALTIPPLGPVALPGADAGPRVTIRAMEGRRPGSRVEVEWKGQYYPAVLLAPRDGGWLVHYEGYDDSWDEVASEDRIRDP